MKEAKINICHIISGDLWAGAEAQAYALIKGLSKKSSLQLNVITFSNGCLTKKLMDAGISVNVIDEKINNVLKMAWHIYRILRGKHIDIIHVHGYKETFLGGLAARFCLVKGVVRTHHGKGVIDSVFCHRLIEKINAIFFSDKLISVSEDLKQHLIAHKYRRDSITVIHNGILSGEIKLSTPVMRLKSELQISSGTFVVGTMGRMVSVKGHRYFLEGAKEVLTRYDNIVFVIAGDGPLMQKTQQEIKQLGIESQVRLIGFRNDPFDVMKMFDIFAMTSLHEGIPMVLLEAMYLEKPIIATKVGGIGEIIIDRWNGLLISPKDRQEFASACLELIKDCTLREKLSNNARKDIISKYGIERVTEDVEKLYKGFL